MSLSSVYKEEFKSYALLLICPTLCNGIDGSLPGSSVHGIFQARILEWVATSFSRGSSQPRDWTCVSCVSCTAGEFFVTELSGEVQGQSICINYLELCTGNCLCLYLFDHQSWLIIMYFVLWLIIQYLITYLLLKLFQLWPLGAFS